MILISAYLCFCSRLCLSPEQNSFIIGSARWHTFSMLAMISKLFFLNENMAKFRPLVRTEAWASARILPDRLTTVLLLGDVQFWLCWGWLAPNNLLCFLVWCVLYWLLNLLYRVCMDSKIGVNWLLGIAEFNLEIKVSMLFFILILLNLWYQILPSTIYKEALCKALSTLLLCVWALSLRSLGMMWSFLHLQRNVRWLISLARCIYDLSSFLNSLCMNELYVCKIDFVS